MGIQQLLPFLEDSTRSCHISEYRGCTAAVDSYSWLHKGVRSCALKLLMGEETNAYVEYCLKYVKMLQHHQIRIVMVFDGRPLPAKRKTELKRRDAKRVAKKQAMEYLRLGEKDKAEKYSAQCVDVTPKMAFNLIKRLREMKIDCIVAPYEADAQLAFFSINKIVDLIITEDSDLLLFGCREVFYKLKQPDGTGRVIKSDQLSLSMKMRHQRYTFEKFRYMCILAGCDYLNSLPGIGLKKALKFLTMTVEENPAIFLDRIPRYLNMGKLQITSEYKRDFCIANATFQHQTVFDPINRILIPLTPIVVSQEYCVNAGEIFDNDEAFQLALGNLNPLTMEKMDDWSPNENNTPKFSIWKPGVCPRDLPPKTIPQFSRPKTPDMSSVQRMQAQKDEQEEKELAYYRSPIPPALIDDRTCKCSPLSPSSSPVLYNPFYKKKDYKVPVPKYDCDQKVRSRFFSDTGDTESPSAPSTITQSESELNEEDASNLTSTMSPLVLSDASKDDTSSPKKDSEYSDGGLIVSCCEVVLDEPRHALVEIHSEPKPPTSDGGLIVSCCEVVLDEPRDARVEIQSEPKPPTSTLSLCNVENLPPEKMKMAGKRKAEPVSTGPKRKIVKQCNLRDMLIKMKGNKV